MIVHEPSVAALARRPVTGPVLATGLIVASWLFVSFGLESLVRVVAGAQAASWVAVPGVFVGFDISIGLVVLSLALVRLARERAARRAEASVPAPALSVLVAAYNEATAIGQTLTALALQTDADFEVLVGDDGSTDGTHEAVIRQFGLESIGPDEWAGLIGFTPLRLFRLPHTGKGGTLNALARHAAHPVLVTIDADTTPDTGALAAMARAFEDPELVSAAGVIAVRNARENWLTQYQNVEYLRITWVRAAWSALGALEQVPGAFTAVRAGAFLAAGGFPTDSLTEDYELTYRLVDAGARAGRVPHVALVLDARVWTEVPNTLAGFIRQRTRWFAGFLSTLFRFRHLMFSPRAGAFGLFRLPVKLADAVMPLLALSSLATLFAGVAHGSAPATALLSLFGARWAWDVTFYSAVLAATAALARPGAKAGHTHAGWVCLLTDSLAYGWLRYATTLRAYVWALGRVQEWEASREPAVSA